MLKPIKGHPGRFLDTSSGQVLNISEYREDDKYDTIVVYGDAQELIVAGKQYIWFRDIEKKHPIDTNFTQPSRLSAGEEMVVDRIGCSVEHMMGGSSSTFYATSGDMMAIIYSGHVRVNVNGLLLADGPMIKFASGYGVAGMVYNGVAGDGVLNIGIPSPAAIPKLVKTQTLTDKHEIIGFLTFFDRSWADWKLANPIVVGMPVIEKSNFIPVKCWLHGLLKVAVNK
jgi:uncharacterized cupin superfamily protein